MNTMTKLQGLLQVRGLDLRVNLGWRDKELSEPQSVLLDIDIFYPDPPKACTSDELEDTICYADLIEKIRTQLADKKFRLIEHLSNDIYQIIEPHVPDEARLMVKITKKPKIEGLTGGVSYSCFKKWEAS